MEYETFDDVAASRSGGNAGLGKLYKKDITREPQALGPAMRLSVSEELLRQTLTT